MPRAKSLTDAADEVRELTAADVKRFKLAKHALSGSLLAKLNVPGAAENTHQGAGHDPPFAGGDSGVP